MKVFQIQADLTLETLPLNLGRGGNCLREMKYHCDHHLRMPGRGQVH